MRISIFIATLIALASAAPGAAKINEDKSKVMMEEPKKDKVVDGRENENLPVERKLGGCAYDSDCCSNSDCWHGYVCIEYDDYGYYGWYGHCVHRSYARYGSRTGGSGSGGYGYGSGSGSRTGGSGSGGYGYGKGSGSGSRTGASGSGGYGHGSGGGGHGTGGGGGHLGDRCSHKRDCRSGRCQQKHDNHKHYCVPRVREGDRGDFCFKHNHCKSVECNKHRNTCRGHHRV